MLDLFYTRIPRKVDAVAVFGAAIFMVYTWTMYVSFWKIPSWLLFLNISEILSIYAYAFLVNFLESLILLFIALVASIILPQGWWKEKFVAKGLALIMIILISAQTHIYFYGLPDTQDVFLQGQLFWWLKTLVIAIIFTWMAGRYNWLNQALIDIADRLVIFMYIYLPLTAIAVLVVLVRILL